MTTIKVRRGTAAQWASANPVLAAGEPGWDSTNNVQKVGDGTTAWASLPVSNNTTYGQLWATPAASATLTGTLAAWAVTAVDCTAGTGARTLPAASSVVAGTTMCAKKADTSANNLVISRAGSDLIFGTGAGATTKTLSLAGEAVDFVSNGVDKWTVRASDTPSAVLASTYLTQASATGTYAPFAATRYGLATRSALAIGGDVDFSTSIADYCQHTPITLPVTTTRWRLRIRNTDGEFGTTVAAAFAFTGVWKGNPTVNADGTLAGTFTATPTKVLNAFTTPSDGSEYVTSWVSDPTQQFTANTKGLIAWGWTCTASTSVARCHAQCWDTPHGDRAGQAAPTSLSAIALAFLEATVEYEYTGNSRVGLFIGDSLTEGQAASGHLLTWPMVYGRRSGDTAVLRAYPGAQTSAFTDPAAYKYTSLGLGTSIIPDYAVIWLGTNDISASVATATIQANIGTVVANARTFGARRVYLATILPRSWSGAQETARTTLNTWMQGLPFNTDGCFDFAALMASSADATVLATAYNSGDNIHINGLGHMVLGNSVPILSAAT